MSSRNDRTNHAAFRFTFAATFALTALVLAHAAGLVAGAPQDEAQGGPSPAPGKPGLNLTTAKAYSGFTLFSPTYGKKFYLIDMDGKLVKEWDTAATPSAHVMLLLNGNFLRPCVW